MYNKLSIADINTMVATFSTEKLTIFAITIVFAATGAVEISIIAL